MLRFFTAPRLTLESDPPFLKQVFSVLFNKKFAVILLTGKSLEMNTRISSLFEQFKMDIFNINNKSGIVETDLNYEEVNRKLEELKQAVKMQKLIKNLNQ